MADVLVHTGGRAIRIARREANVLASAAAPRSQRATLAALTLQLKLSDAVSHRDAVVPITLDPNESAAALVALERLRRNEALSATLEQLRQLLDTQADALTAADEQATILLVDDDEQVRSLIDRHLTRLGYRVLVASDGHQALALAAAEHRLDALITDLLLPVISGVAIAARLRERWPNLKVLFISGWLAEQSTPYGYTTQLGPLLPKPFTPDELAAALTGLLPHDRP